MVHKPKHRVHSFRGLLADGGQDEINLERSNVNLAYRIVKLALFPKTVGSSETGTEYESLVQVWREASPTTPSECDFNITDTLAAASYISEVSGSPAYVIGTDTTVVFDNVLFSRNIYVTHNNNHADAGAINYYLEIEEVPVGAATLMQIKLGSARKLISDSMG